MLAAGLQLRLEQVPQQDAASDAMFLSTSCLKPLMQVKEKQPTALKEQEQTAVKEQQQIGGGGFSRGDAAELCQPLRLSYSKVVYGCHVEPKKSTETAVSSGHDWGRTFVPNRALSVC
jgi:hypothetical protein